MLKYSRKKDVGIYGLSAKWYDKNMRKSRLGEVKAYVKEIKTYLNKDAKILEIAPGPGYASLLLAKHGYDVTGVEYSSDFVEIENKNAAKIGVNVNFTQGNASDLKLDDACFDFVICVAAFKNFKEPIKALSEMHRVLKNGGTALIIDANHDATKEDRDEAINNMDIKGFDKLLISFSFKTFLTNSAYNKSDLKDMLEQAGISNYDIKKQDICIKVYLYK